MRQWKGIKRNCIEFFSPICLIPGWLLDNMPPVGFKYTSSESTNLWSIRSFLVNIILLIIIISDNITIINMIKITTRSISLAASLWWSLGSASSSTQRSNRIYWSNGKWFDNQIVFIIFDIVTSLDRLYPVGCLSWLFCSWSSSMYSTTSAPRWLHFDYIPHICHRRCLY